MWSAISNICICYVFLIIPELGILNLQISLTIFEQLTSSWWYYLYSYNLAKVFNNFYSISYHFECFELRVEIINIITIDFN